MSLQETLLTVQLAHFPGDLQAVEAIFREYVQSPKADLGFQNYETEFAHLPGAYAAPKGCVMLVRHQGDVVGCAALRPINQSTCELKRVYLRPTVRGHDGGRLLVQAMLDHARSLEYQRMCLDVLPEFETAQRLYEKLGFTDAPPVTYNPVPGTRFMALML
jgi:RimJ/RimL family protein N-acetyltransferase